MRRIARINRLDRSIGILRCGTPAPIQSPYLCSACAAHTTSFSTSSIRPARPTTYTDKLRQKIWGTDAPPGLDDPYGGGSMLDKYMEKRRKAEGKEETQLVGTTKARTESSTPAATYEPAETWDGLEEVGGEEIWESEHPFKSFIPPETTIEDEVITLSFHRAMVEVFSAQQAGQPLSIVSQAEPGDYLTEDVQLVPSPTGVSLQFPATVSLEEIVQSLSPEIDETKEKSSPTESEEDVAADRSNVELLHPEPPSVIVDETATKELPTESEEDVAADRSTVDPLKQDASSVRTYADVIGAWDPSWLQVSLEDPEIKFAVLKRTMQLTGIRIPDSVISSANTAKALLNHLLTKPKPRKLVDALVQRDELIALPNVSIYPERITPIDKETMVGRWKVIKKELEERGLPTTGH